MVVTAHGELSAEHLPVLGRVIREAADERLDVILDFEAVTLADRESIVFLARGEGRRARIRRAPAYVQEWIRIETRKENPAVSKLNSLALALIFVGSMVGMGCDHLRSKDLGKEEPAAAEKVAKAPATLNPYQKN